MSNTHIMTGGRAGELLQAHLAAEAFELGKPTYKITHLPMEMRWGNDASRGMLIHARKAISATMNKATYARGRASYGRRVTL